AQSPEVHAIGTDADGAATAARAEWEDLIKAVEQTSPLPVLDQPVELGPVGGELQFRQPLPQMFQGLFLESGVRLDTLNPRRGLLHQVHDVTSSKKNHDSVDRGNNVWAGNLPSWRCGGNGGGSRKGQGWFS